MASDSQASEAREPDTLALQSRPLAVDVPIPQVRQTIGELTANAHRVGLRRSMSQARGDVNGMQLRHLGLVSIRYSEPVEITSLPTGDRVLVVVPRAPMQVTSGNATWTSADPFTMSTEHATRLVPTPGQGALVAALDVAVLEDYLEAATGRRFRDPLQLASDTRPLRLGAPELVTSAYREGCRTLDGPGVDAMTIALVEKYLLSATALGAASLVGHLLRGSDELGPGYLELARDYVERHLHEPLGVGALADACNISERQLHAVFAERLGTTPAAYIRERRVVRAHGLLTDPEMAEQATVASLIARVGVGHPGRFAAQYQERYGCTPSATLSRTKSLLRDSVTR